MKTIESIKKDFQNNWCEETDDGTYIISYKDDVFLEDWIEQQMKELLMTMPQDNGTYEQVAGGGEYSKGYNDARKDLKEWRNKVIGK